MCTLISHFYFTHHQHRRSSTISTYKYDESRRHHSFSISSFILMYILYIFPLRIQNSEWWIRRYAIKYFPSVFIWNYWNVNNLIIIRYFRIWCVPFISFKPSRYVWCGVAAKVTRKGGSNAQRMLYRSADCVKPYSCEFRIHIFTRMM